ncbi:hypothetical protein JCM3775_004437, partial [Rhodotorula graminis]
LPETRNIPLEEMDRLFAQKNVWRANQIVMAELQREHELGAERGPSYLKPQAGSSIEEVEDVKERV